MRVSPENKLSFCHSIQVVGAESAADFNIVCTVSEQTLLHYPFTLPIATQSLGCKNLARPLRPVSFAHIPRLKKFDNEIIMNISISAALPRLGLVFEW